jgi:plastocyanin
MRIFVCAIFFTLTTAPIVTHAAEYVVSITERGFEPSQIEMTEGDTITFVNDDDALHWPASNDHPTHTVYPGADIRDCDTGNPAVFDACHGLGRDERVTFTLSRAGEWGFHDHLNPTLKGTAIVRSTGETPLFVLHNDTLSLPRKVAAWILHAWYGFFPDRAVLRVAELNLVNISRSDAETEYWMRIFGANALLDELVKDTADPTQFTGIQNVEPLIGQCHLRAHFLGRIAARLFGISAIDERTLDTRCQFGFYHGVIEASLGDIGDDETMKAFAARCLRNDISPMQSIFCEHVIGHGLMVYHNYDLPCALQKCAEIVSNDLGRRMCYHGAYMENIFVTLGYGVSGHTTTWVDPKKTDFPCTSDALPNDLQTRAMCYFTQTLIWSPLGKFDGKAAIQGCMRAPKEVRTICFAGIGFHSAFPLAAQSDEVLAETCLQAPAPEYRKACLLNALFLYSTVRTTFDGFKNQALCSALGIPELDACNMYATKELSWLLK